MADDEEIVPVVKHSSSNLIVAADELKFRQEQAQEKLKMAETSGDTAAKQKAQAELRKAYSTLAHQMDKIQLQKEYKVDFTKGIESANVRNLLNCSFM